MVISRFKLCISVAVVFGVIGSHCFGCELFGFSFSKPVNSGSMLERFWLNGNKNPHGWGIVYKEKGKLKTIKEESNASQSSKAAATVQMGIRKKIILT